MALLSPAKQLPVVTLSALLCIAVTLAPACGSEDSTFGDGSSSGGASSGSSGSFAADSGLTGDATGPGSVDGSACQTSENRAALQPIYLGFAFDVSGSMGELDCPFWNHDPKIKWRPVVDATVSFFEDVASTNINASLTLFPALTDKCGASAYATPSVAMTALPSQAFAQRLAAYEVEGGLAGYTDPMPVGGGSWRGGTPTLAAVNGTVGSIGVLKVAKPDSKFGLVLVTDGLPQGCAGDDDIAKVIAAVATAKNVNAIPTYVIGVRDPALPPATAPWQQGGSRRWACRDGNNDWINDYDQIDTPRPTNPALLDNLNAIAAAGGTTAAFLIDTGNPVATKAAFVAAVNDIRAKSISCELKRPPPPNGQTFDPDKVNVRYDSGSARTPLGFDPQCTASNAWRYKGTDNDVIELCPSTCAVVQRDAQAALQVEFGCVRRDVVK